MIKISTDTYKAFQRTSNPRMAEKDYIECAILEELFNDPYISKQFVFAGGGSITKSYNFSQRIGQDIDLACADFEELPDEHSKKQLTNFKKRFKTFVFDVLKPKVNYIINQDQQFMIATDRDWRALENKEQFLSSPTLHVLYKSAFGPEMGHLCLEIIPRKYKENKIQHRSVVPYSIKQEMGDIPTVRYEQTFWDKVFALHSTAKTEMPRLRETFSRHYYDVARIADHVNLNETKEFLFDISNYQTKYTTKGIPPLTSTAEVELIPEDATLTRLGEDYAKISELFLKNPESWQSIIRNLIQLNNNLKTL